MVDLGLISSRFSRSLTRSIPLCTKKLTPIDVEQVCLMFGRSRAQHAFVIAGVLSLSGSQQQLLAVVLQRQTRIAAVRQPAVRQDHAILAPTDENLVLVRDFAVEDDVSANEDATSGSG